MSIKNELFQKARISNLFVHKQAKPKAQVWKHLWLKKPPHFSKKPYMMRAEPNNMSIFIRAGKIFPRPYYYNRYYYTLV